MSVQARLEVDGGRHPKPKAAAIDSASTVSNC